MKTIQLQFFSDQAIFSAPSLFKKSSSEPNTVQLFPKLAGSTERKEGFKTNLETVAFRIHAKGAESSAHTSSYLLPSSEIVLTAKQEVVEVEEAGREQGVDESKEISSAEVAEPTANTAKEMVYDIQCHLPPYEELITLLHLTNNAATPIHQFGISMSLDGHSIPDESKWSTFYFYSNLGNYAIQPAVPKGGAAAGNVITLVLEDYCYGVTASQMTVRLRGNDPNGTTAQITVTAVNEVTTPKHATSIVFTLPDAATLTSIPPVMNGKEKWYFLDISLDEGQHFDSATTALLQVK